MNHTGTVKLETDRLVLRKFTMDDVDCVYHNYGSDPLVNRYITFAPCAELEQTKDFIQMHIKQYESNLEFYGWAITLNNEVIGSIGLFDVDNTLEEAELGYSIGSKWWGKGYAIEAAKNVMEYAFKVVGFHRIHASHHKDNVASGNVLKKIGMHCEGILPDGQKNADGTYSDLILYDILQPEREEQ